MNCYNEFNFQNKKKINQQEKHCGNAEKTLFPSVKSASQLT